MVYIPQRRTVQRSKKQIGVMKNIIKFKVGAIYSRRSTLNHNGTEYTMATHYYRVTKRIGEPINPNYPHIASRGGFLEITNCDSDGSRDSYFFKDMKGFKCTVELRSGRVEVVNTMGSHNDRVSGGYPEMVLSSATSLCHQLT